MDNNLENKKNNSRINILYFERIYLVKLPCKFRNQGWAEDFGQIQKDLRNLKKSIEQVIIDATACEWVDPLPMLSLTIALSEKTDIYKEFIIPSLDDINTNQKKVLAFLEKEGFLSELNRHGVNVLSGSEKTIYAENNDFKNKIIQDFGNELQYTESTILEATVTDLKKIGIENIDSYIDSQIAKVRHRITKKISSSFEIEIISKISLFLKETIENVYEHAYSNSNNLKLVGYYIRFRNGLGNSSLNLDVRQKLQKAISLENEDMVLFKKSLINGVNQFIEIFVIDAGIGLTTNYFNSNLGNKKRFIEAWRDTIGLGKRGTLGPKKNTKFGGLYTLSRLLQDNFLLARDHDYWIGDTLPIVSENIGYDKNSSYRMATFSSEKPKIEGLSLIARISWGHTTDNKNWKFIYESKNPDIFIEAIQEKKDIYEKYFNKSFIELENNPFYIRDERFDYINKKLDKYYFNKKEHAKYCLYLPSENVSKNFIYSKFKKTVNELAYIKSSSIIIADIPDEYSSLYQYALENARYDQSEINNLNKLDKIILVTRSLSVLILKKVLTQKGPTYKYDDNLTEKYITEHTSFFSPDTSMLNLIEWLRTHDSMLLWQYIKDKNIQEEYYINRPIVWFQGNQDIGLYGYLNFEKTLADSYIRNLYDFSLRRALCLSQNSFLFISIDPLTEGISALFNSLYNNKDNGISYKILLGSVFVSGYTEKNSELSKINSASNLKIHFFLNSNTNIENADKLVCHLLLWPRKGLDWFNENLSPQTETIKNRNLKRVSSTYAVAPFGWRYFPIPRYKPFDLSKNHFFNEYFFSKVDYNNIDFVSIYKCMPSITYEYWQGKRNQFVSIEHTDYETKHDILKIDFPYITTESFLLGSDLSCFLLGEFILSLNIDEESINYDDNTRLKEGVENYIEENSYCKWNEWRNEKCHFINKLLIEIEHSKLNSFSIEKISEWIEKYEDDCLWNISKEKICPFKLALCNQQYTHISDVENRIIDFYKQKFDCTKRIFLEEKRCAFIVYPYHYNTEHVIKLIKKYLGQNNVNNIIALIPINKERSGTSFLISPVTLEAVKSRIAEYKKNNTNKKLNVLLFDDAIVDGKNRAEIKHILYGLGVDSVRTLCILERRRLPFNTSNNRYNVAFWRLDIPRLGTKYTCPLCYSIGKMENYLNNQITSKNAIERIKNWIEIWNAKSPYGRHKDITLTPSLLSNMTEEQKYKRFGIYFEGEECKQCGGDDNKIKISNSIGLSIYMGELLSMTSRDNKLLQYCNNEFKIDPTAKLEMLCMNLLLFGKNISLSTREEIVFQIFSIANSLEECNHTSFAALTLISQDRFILEDLFDKIKDPYSLDIVLKNFDLQILLSYISSYLDSKFNNVKSLKRLRGGIRSIKEIYEQFHSEIYNDNGESHDTPIQSIIKMGYSGIQNIRDSEDSLDKIKYLLENIPKWNLLNIDNDKQIFFEDINECIDNCKISSKQIVDIKDIKPGNKLIISYRNDIVILFEKLNILHQSLFLPLNISNKNNIRSVKNIIQEIVSEFFSMNVSISESFCNFNFKKYLSLNNINERWIIWDKEVYTELKYLIQNSVTHSVEYLNKSENAFENNICSWIEIDHLPEQKIFQIIICNRSSENAEIVREKTKYKNNRSSQVHLRDLSIIIDYVDEENDILKTIINFPIL